MPIRVLLVSNFRLLASALQSLLEAQPQRFAHVATANSPAQARELITISPIDVVLLDIDSDTAATLPLIADLRAASSAKILLLTRLENTALEDQALLAGARGLINRHISTETLLSALEKVHTGQLWLNREATGRLFVELSRASHNKPAEPASPASARLTEREQEIVTLMARLSGQPGKTIAEKLHISESTLRNHLTSIYDKLGVVNRHGLLAYAYQNGWATQALR